MLTATMSTIAAGMTAASRFTAGRKAWLCARAAMGLGGPPKALSADDLKKARALLRSGDYTKVQPC